MKKYKITKSMINCLLCNQPMILIKKVRPIEKTSLIKKTYNVYQYSCDLCRITQTVYGSNGIDKQEESKYIKSKKNESKI